MPKKKGKKQPVNPARGFATTSIASKSQLPTEASDSPEHQSEAPSTIVAGQPRRETRAQDEQSSKEFLPHTHQISPQELEEQLENDELQLLLERHSPRVSKESSRHVTKFQTDCRLLRAQSSILYSRDWLPTQLLDEILDYATQETDHRTVTNEVGPRSSHSNLEMVSINLWILYEILTKVGLPESRVRQCFDWLLRFRLDVDMEAQPWGLREALDWLALNSDEAELPAYDGQKHVKLASPDSQIATQFADSNFDENPQVKEITEACSTVEEKSMTSSSVPLVEDVEVSDLDSDLEPDQMISTYLQRKLRLLQIEPDGLSKSRAGKKRNGEADANSINKPLSSGIKKLRDQLGKIESDILFDKDEAQQQWITIRNQHEQEEAAKRRLELLTEKANGVSKRQEFSPEDIKNLPLSVGDEEQGIAKNCPSEEDHSDSESLLGAFFATNGDETARDESHQNEPNGDQSTFVIREFPMSVGSLNPRRALEGACQARDKNVRITYKRLSSPSFSSRHAVEISWSRDQSLTSLSLPSIVYTTEPKFTSCAMTGIAAPNPSQSEGFVATAALFLVVGPSQKEDKIHLRLPASFKDLWTEFLNAKKEEVDAARRERLRELRDMVNGHLEREQEEGIVVAASFRKRTGQSALLTDGEAVQRPESSSTPMDADQIKAMWLQKTSTAAYQRMLSIRSGLPIFNFRQAIVTALDTNQVIILCGETGCGKSTQVPSYLLEHELSRGRPCKIYCTEPRRISAISLAHRVSEELGERRSDLGTNRSMVGYAIRLESRVSPQTKLIYATVGIVLRMLEYRPELDDVTHLIIDEVHERSIDSDFLLIVVRSLMLRRPQLRVVLMSATVDAQRFSSYLYAAPILTVPGRTFPVQTRFLEDAIELTKHTAHGSPDAKSTEEEDVDEGPRDRKLPNLETLRSYSASTQRTVLSFNEYHIDYDLIVKLIEKIAFQPKYVSYSKAILVFLPGMAEIRRLYDMLVSNSSFSEGWYLHTLHSAIASDEQQQAFQVPPQGFRKIVLATNIAETGITIPDITAVIDTCKHKEMRFDERRQLSRLVQSFISKANAKQRRGRAGRVQEGICFHLVTKHRHDELMAEQQTPEILRLSLQDLVMRVRICKLGDIEQTLSEALDPPSSKNIRRAIDALVEVGALDVAEELTPLGTQLAKLPLDAILGKLVVYAAVFGCVDVGLTIAAILSSKPPFLDAVGAKQQVEAAKLRFKRAESELITAYNAYAAWRRVCGTPGASELDFCRRNLLSSQNLNAIEDLKGQLAAALVEAGFVERKHYERLSADRSRQAVRQRQFVAIDSSYNLNNENDLLVTTVIAWAFYPKLLVRDGKGWRNVSSSQSVSLPPTSILKSSTSAKYLSYHHIMQASNKFYNAHSTSIVHELPLLLLAGDAEFRLHAGVIILDGNRLKFAVKDWKTMIALKTLRLRAREIMVKLLKSPHKPLSSRLERWKDILVKLFLREDENGAGRS